MLCEILMRGGARVARELAEESLPGGGVRLTLARADVPAGFDEVRLLPGLFDARAGEDGYYAAPFCNAQFLTRFRERPDCTFSFSAAYLSFIGMRRADGSAVLLIFDGMRLGIETQIAVAGGAYSMTPRIRRAETSVYEDVSLVLLPLAGADANYSGMARAYRAHELAAGRCRPLAEKAAERPLLARIARAPEIRIRLAWKPAPPDVPEQTPENEPPLHVACTFGQVERLVAELKRQGVPDAQICLVGWNIAGHDGRYPQMFPVEERLGGEAGLRRLIRTAQDAGYLITCHTNSTDAYSVSEDFSPDILLRGADGEAVSGGAWSGGRMYEVCPHAARRFARRDLPRVRALGFHGAHYIDVISTVAPRQCLDPAHPATRAECAAIWEEILREAAGKFGAVSSEGTWGYLASVVDFGLYSAFSLMSRLPAVADETVPLFPLVYHGIMLYNTSSETVNYPVKSAAIRLKFYEYGGRPAIYYYSKFMRGNAWMGEDDFRMDTEDELRDTVARIRSMTDEYRAVSALQYAFMEEHEAAAPGVYRVRYSNGTRLIVNYSGEEFSEEGVRVPAGELSFLP